MECDIFPNIKKTKLLLLLSYLATIGATNNEYVTIMDFTQTKSIDIRMEPLYFNVDKNQSNVFFHTKGKDKLHLFYCGNNKHLLKSHLSNLEIEWIVPIETNDMNIMILFLNRGLICKAVTASHIFSFKIYKGNTLPNIKPIIFKSIDETILHKRYHTWIQVTIVIFATISIIAISTTVFCIIHKAKSLNVV
jgi:hypothetical protein